MRFTGPIVIIVGSAKISNTWFLRKRGRVAIVFVCGFHLMILFPNFISPLIKWLGWRTAFHWCGLVSGVGMLVFGYVFFRNKGPGYYGMKQDGGMLPVGSPRRNGGSGRNANGGTDSISNDKSNGINGNGGNNNGEGNVDRFAIANGTNGTNGAHINTLADASKPNTPADITVNIPLSEKPSSKEKGGETGKRKEKGRKMPIPLPIGVGSVPMAIGTVGPGSKVKVDADSEALDSDDNSEDNLDDDSNKDSNKDSDDDDDDDDPASSEEIHYTLKEAMKTPHFWPFIISILVVEVTWTGTNYNFIALLGPNSPHGISVSEQELL
jgi:hypothetical protein